MTPSTSRKIADLTRYALLLIVAFDSLLIWMSYRNTVAVMLALQTRVVEQQLASDIKDAECGQRGFLLTDGDESYLPQYYVGVSSTKTDIIVLERYLKDQPQQQAIVDELKKAVALKLFELDSTVRAYRDGKPEKAKAIVMSGLGMQQMDRINSLITLLRAQQRINSTKKRWFF